MATISQALRTTLLLAFAASVFILEGCTASPWQSNFVSTAPSAALATDAPVQIREVPWDRLQQGLGELEAQASGSDVHPADWSPQQKEEAKAKLLKTLQVSENPSSVTIIGRSDFRSTTEIHPESNDQADLINFARRVGATKVVWSRRLLGKEDVIIQEPVTTYSSGFDDHWGHRHGNVPFTYTSTTWVPLQVAADQYAYVAYFLRT
jgi:hypothetical protein